MSKTTVKLLIDPEKNSLTFSKNFRIFKTAEPISGISSLTDYIEDVIISSPDALDLNYLRRYLRYSRNLSDWSLWYEVEPGNIGEAGDIIFEDGSNFYIEIKYEYDDGTFNEMGSVIEINEIRLRFLNSTTAGVQNTFSPIVICSDERCNSIIAKSDPKFKPYEVDSSVNMFKELSFYTNVVFGHDVVYFRTVPESDSGDYIFKEWTLYKNVDRKCIKIMVPGNKFPSMDPKFSEFELDFQLPFEIHVDNRYFQSIFGKGSHPRHRDFLYFPLLNRMYEVQGSYLNRSSIMMTPVFWKVSLKKYNPNIDMLLTDDTRHFLDNVIQSAEELFKNEVESDIKDGIMPNQYDVISRRFDSSRNSIHPELRIRPLKYTFNHASLIENYYDLESLNQTDASYRITTGSPVNSNDVNLVSLPSLNDGDTGSYNVILAYQDSDPFISWRNNFLITTDKNVSGNNVKFIRVRGPIDTIPNHIGTSESGRYIRIEAYSDLSFKKQRPIMTTFDSNGNPIVKFKVREPSVIYNAEPQFNLTDLCNISFTALFNVNGSADIIQFINGWDNETQRGIKISGQFVRYIGSEPEGDLNILIEINGSQKSYSINNFVSGEWHAIVISISNEFKQIGAYIYAIKEDPADIINHNEFIEVLNQQDSFQPQEFDLVGQKYYIPSSNMLLSNIRLFNTMIREEDHDFILSQQYIKDESKLLIIDNCKPQLNLPYISKNR